MIWRKQRKMILPKRNWGTSGNDEGQKYKNNYMSR